MSHQSGIQAGANLCDFFAGAKDGSVRLIKVGITGEELTLEHHDRTTNELDWQADYDRLVQPHLDPKQSCYLLYRLDSMNQLGHDWVFIHWVPNHAPVRQKMLFASTRATLRKEFGDSYFCQDLPGQVESDVTLEGYLKHVESRNAPPPLSMAEVELNEIKKTEIRQTALNEGRQTMKGIDFPLTDDLQDKIEQFTQKQIDYVQLRINVGTEEVDLGDHVTHLTTADLRREHWPADEPRYHLFRFRHNFEGNQEEPLVFIYTMPGYKCSIKERMLYSSCKASLVVRLERYLKTTVDKKMEVEATEELEEHSLMELFHPPEVEDTKKFSKPKGPGGRGPRRLIKDST